MKQKLSLLIASTLLCCSIAHAGIVDSCPNIMGMQFGAIKDGYIDNLQVSWHYVPAQGTPEIADSSFITEFVDSGVSDVPGRIVAFYKTNDPNVPQVRLFTDNVYYPADHFIRGREHGASCYTKDPLNCKFTDTNNL